MMVHCLYPEKSVKDSSRPQAFKVQARLIWARLGTAAASLLWPIPP
jgi:hypothetical protein